MAASKFSISVTAELEVALKALATRRGEDRSRLIETLLRENPLVASEIRSLRTASEGPPALKKGRSMEELVLLGRVARESLAQRLASGKVKIPGWN